GERSWRAQKIIGIRGEVTIRPVLVRRVLVGAGIFATHVEIQELIEALAANVHTELGGVVSEYLGVIVRPLESIAGLWQFAFEVVTQRESTGNVHVRNADAAGKIGGDSRRRIAWGPNAIPRRHSRAAGSLHTS